MPFSYYNNKPPQREKKTKHKQQRLMGKSSRPESHKIIV